MIRYARLGIEIDIEAVQKEVNALNEPWLLHFNTKHYEGEWKVISLRAPGGKSNQIIPDIIDDSNTSYLDTPLMNFCPAIQSLLKRLKCPILSVRLLNLKSGSVIKAHRDHELSFEKGEARLHFPVFTNEAVEFYIEDDLIKMREGECWYINANLSHRVANRGGSDRIHLVVDCSVNDWLKTVFDTSEKTTASAISNKAELLQIINELKRQDTDAARKLAAELEQSFSS